jgi:hypothetical protein
MMKHRTSSNIERRNFKRVDNIGFSKIVVSSFKIMSYWNRIVLPSLHPSRKRQDSSSITKRNSRPSHHGVFCSDKPADPSDSFATGSCPSASEPPLLEFVAKERRSPEKLERKQYTEKRPFQVDDLCWNRQTAPDGCRVISADAR